MSKVQLCSITTSPADCTAFLSSRSQRCNHPLITAWFTGRNDRRSPSIPHRLCFSIAAARLYVVIKNSSGCLPQLRNTSGSSSTQCTAASTGCFVHFLESSRNEITSPINRFTSTKLAQNSGP